MPDYSETFKSIRVWELIVCLICLVLSAVTLKNLQLNESLKLYLVILSAVCTCLTSADLILTRCREIPWTYGIPLLLLASLMFFLCVGFHLSIRKVGPFLYESSLVAYSLAGSLFLFDVMDTIRRNTVGGKSSRYPYF
ncbi:hypothetical protein PPYR_12609 [Photinus pyralis]|uniref:Uncharacterized protein n=1 Tax=Photinus pyralis TaxID=7054 RepID=A0A5N4A6U7_PHOPY|nr:hypothetical protein PPYR_12609 [Photinus pyralis]